MSVYRSYLNRQRSTIRGLRAYGLGFKQNTGSKTLPPDTPGYVEIRPACEARASTGYNRIRLDTFPTPLPVKGRYTRIHAIRPISMLLAREPAHDTTGYVAIRLPPALPAPHPDHPDTTRYVHYGGDRDKARYDRIRLDTLLFGRLLLDADMPGDDCCVHTQKCLSSSSRVLLASKNLKENPILAGRNQLRATCPARTGMTASTCLRFLLCLETSCSS